ncbi:MAG: DUF2442 domain-containing protein [Bacteroidaceae bacterium]|nr:DUF2442 domain-containing protein [Bacteroidaceae bacterium]
MKRYIDKVWTDDHAVYASTSDGLEASYEFALWPSLAKATAAQREDFYLSYSGIHWPQIDEDLSFKGMFTHANLCTQDSPENSFVYEAEQVGIVAEDDGPQYGK